MVSAFSPWANEHILCAAYRPISVGMVPEIAFSAITREVNAVRSPMDVGRVPRSSEFPKKSIFSDANYVRRGKNQEMHTEHSESATYQCF